MLQVGAVGGQVRPSGAAAAPLRPRFLVQRDQEAPKSSPWALFRARRRRWARAAEGGGGGRFRKKMVLLPIAPKKSDFFKIRNFNFWHYSRMRASMAYLVPYFFSQKVTTVQSYSTLCTFHLGTTFFSVLTSYKNRNLLYECSPNVRRRASAKSNSDINH